MCAQFRYRMDGTSGRMINPSLGTFQMRFWVIAAGRFDVALKRLTVFAEVVPQASEISPVRTSELLGKGCGQVSHGKQVFLQAVL